MVKAESVARLESKSPLPESVAATRAKLEKRLGTAAAVVRSNPEPVLQEALRLRR
jgi:hypothetical protein